MAIVFLVAWLPCTPAEAHEPPPQYHQIAADEALMTWQVFVDPSFVRSWVGGDPLKPVALDVEERADAIGKLKERLPEWAPVRVDRIPVKPVFQSIEPIEFEDHGLTVRYEVITFTYGLKGRPRELELAWRQFDAPTGAWVNEIDAELNAFGQTEYLALRRKEPGFTLHVPSRSELPKPFEPPTVRVPPKMQVPLVSAGLVVVLLVLTALTLWGPVGRRTGIAAIATCAALAVVLADSAKMGFVVPWAPKYERPSEDQAARIFESLHRNIYRAFDYEAEDDIYETLARSVSGAMLDAIYGEVYESMIFRHEGGAVGKIISTEILERVVRFPDDPAAPWYSVDCRWRVQGKVGHWGHTHERINEYRATYQVEQQGSTWKIGGVDVVDQVRVDEGDRR